MFCDGAVRPRKFGWAGIGVTIHTNVGHLIEAQERESISLGPLGINETEICAGIFALRRVFELVGASEVIVHTDSTLFVEFFAGRWRPRAENLRGRWALFRKEVKRHRLVQVVKVDSEDERLRLADELSKSAAARCRQRAEGAQVSKETVRIIAGTASSRRSRRLAQRFRGRRRLTL